MSANRKNRNAGSERGIRNFLKGTDDGMISRKAAKSMIMKSYNNGKAKGRKSTFRGLYRSGALRSKN